MQIVTQKYLNRIGAVKVWSTANQTRLGAVPAFAALQSQLLDAESQIKAHAQAQTQSEGGVGQNVVLKAELLDAIRHDIDDLVRGAKVIDLTQPGFSANFTAPTSGGEQAILATARVFAANLQSQATQDALTHIGMPADTAADLTADVTHFNDYNTGKDAAQQARTADLKALDDAIRASSQAIDSLDAIVHFVFGNDKIKLSGWNEAKRLEQTRAHRATPEHAALQAALPPTSAA